VQLTVALILVGHLRSVWCIWWWRRWV